jgi:hypothetical protein
MTCSSIIRRLSLKYTTGGEKQYSFHSRVILYHGMVLTGTGLYRWIPIIL